MARQKLEVKTVSTPFGRAKVVKLPGHRFRIEHFFPANLEHEEYLGQSRRVRLVRSRVNRRQLFAAIARSNYFAALLLLLAIITFLTTSEFA